MTTERKVGPEDVYIYVGKGVHMSDDANRALQDLADALSGEGSEVSGFLMGDDDPLGIMTMIMVMLPDVRVSSGPISVATGGCAVDVVLGPTIERN